MSPPLPKTAPFSAEDTAALNAIVGRSNGEQRTWLAGFLAGYEAALAGASMQPAPLPIAVAAPRVKVPVTLLYGSESGNAEGLALKAKKAAAKLGYDAKVVDMGDVEPAALAKMTNVVVYVSTWGEGAPPQRAIEFYNGLMADTAPRLDGLRYSVLALGDTAYAEFCATGKLIDARLAELGGQRIADRIDLDLDFAKAAAEWTERTLTALRPADDTGVDGQGHNTRVVHVDFKPIAATAAEIDEPLFTADAPAEAEISALVNLNGTGSTRETWHVELAVTDADFHYSPGDAIGVVPENDPELASALLSAVGLGADGGLVKQLVTRHDITTLSRPLVQAYAKLTGRADVAALGDADAFKPYANDRQLLDLFAEHPERLTAAQLTGLLRPLPGRLYSVASSLKAHEGEAHLLVGAVRWASHSRARKGVTSTYFADRRKPGQTAKIYVKANRHFRLPTDGARPIIMIGAGTGLAPYRAFVEERAADGATGKSWLFFGERNYTNDFLYQLEWQDHLAAGALTRIDLAFSRDQPEKIYVQHRLLERRDEVKGWLNDGAHLYVCGDEKGMAKDVELALIDILGGGEKGLSALSGLRKAGRYQRDVY